MRTPGAGRTMKTTSKQVLRKMSESRRRAGEILLGEEGGRSVSARHFDGERRRRRQVERRVLGRARQNVRARGERSCAGR